MDVGERRPDLKMGFVELGNGTKRGVCGIRGQCRCA